MNFVSIMYFVGKMNWSYHFLKNNRPTRKTGWPIKREISHFFKRLINRLCFYYIIRILQQNLILFNSRLQFVSEPLQIFCESPLMQTKTIYKQKAGWSQWQVKG